MQKQSHLNQHSLVLFDPIECCHSCQNGPGSDGNEDILRIPQSSSITGTSLSDCLVSYTGHSLVGVLLLCREAVGVFYSLPCRLGWPTRAEGVLNTYICMFSSIPLQY